MPSLHISSIFLSSFKATLARYSNAAPPALTDLDTLRYETIPAKLAKTKKDSCLQKSDVEELVEWKLKHGTYRPALMGLVKSNPADLVKSTTSEAFSAYAKNGDTMGALKILIKLRGIGPATASLLLSVYKPDEVPFFSDELFRWAHWDSPGKTGWGRRIKYNITEYKELLTSVENLRKRLGITAVDAEKVAYVLGNESVDVGAEMVENRGEEAESEHTEDRIVGKKIEENEEKDGKANEAAAGAATDIDREKTEDPLDGTSKEYDMIGVTKKKNERKEGNTNAVMGKEGLLKEEVTGGTKKRATKRKAEDAKVLTEGTRRSIRRKR